jgi:alkanesulfonate monooxygenase SsuD/methylene tetrahydromethanopterin reductase-like flavin-dependent oxidoreductase (luciferase family)
MTIQFGLILSPGPLKGEIERWLQDLDDVLPVLESHVDSLWMPDHFFWDDMPTYEAMTVLTYLAARFPAYHVGTGVLGQTYRNPALLAKMGATLQALSGGRFIMGIGAGWKEDEHLAYNIPYPSAKIRLEQLEDTLQILRLMWTTPGPITFEGSHYRVKDAYCEPLPDPVPTIMVGGGGKTTMLHAARYADWWNISDVPANYYAERLNTLRSHCESLGRDFSTIRKTWYGRMVLGTTEAEARHRGQTQGRDHYDGWTLDAALIGTPAQVVDQIAAFVDLGVDYFMVDILDVHLPVIQELLLETVISTAQALSS